jgi:serine/threonine-protein kinase HipA
VTIAADVYKDTQLAGTLERLEDRVEFRYLPEYSGEPAATSLPVSNKAVESPAGQLPPFFVGLLPEGRRLSALIRALKVSADDELSLLLAVGSDTVGDIRVIPAGEKLADPTPYVTDHDWDDLDFDELFARSVGADFDRAAIPGVQPKVSGQMISFPVAGAVGPVILKLNPPEYSHLVEVESAIMDAASQSKAYKVPGHALVTDRNGQLGFIVQRFDRLTVESSLSRLPVEDGCQAMARYPADKYNLDTIEVIGSLAEQCTAPAVARLQLLERFLLSYLAADGDFHARNMAITKTKAGLWEPSPVYDVICTAVYSDTTLAAPFNGRENVREMGRRRILEAAAELQIPDKAATHTLDRLVPEVAAAIQSALALPVFSNFPDQKKAQRLTARRAELLLA